MKPNQSEIAKKAKISAAMLSMILSGKKRPSWNTAKSLSMVTGTSPVLWMEGTPDQIREAVCSNCHPQDTDPVFQNESKNFESI